MKSQKKPIDLIIGADGQDGRVLQEILGQRSRALLLQNRTSIRTSFSSEERMITAQEIELIFKTYQISNVYFLAAEHSPALSKNDSVEIFPLNKQLELISETLISVLESIRKFSPETRFFFSSSVLIFGSPNITPQNEFCEQRPHELYGLAKKLSQDIVAYYRDNLGLFASSGILYPHESHHRSDNFLYKQIINFVRSLDQNPGAKLTISDLSFTREWNCAYQVMESVIGILNHNQPTDFVIGSGVSHSIREICRLAFQEKGFDYQDYVIESGERLISRSPNLVADAAKLQKLVGIAPNGDINSLLKRTFESLGA